MRLWQAHLIGERRECVHSGEADDDEAAEDPSALPGLVVKSRKCEPGPHGREVDAPGNAWRRALRNYQALCAPVGALQVLVILDP